MSNFNNLNWEISGLETKNETKIMQATKEGHYTNDIVRTELQTLSNHFASKGVTGRIGVAMHYSDLNDWLPALFTAFGDKVNLFSIADSPSLEKFLGDKIDSIQIYVIKNGNMEINELENKKEISHLKPKSKKEKKLSFKQLFKVTKT
jgi:hypothetical protein